MSSRANADELTQRIITIVNTRKPQNLTQLVFFVREDVLVSEEEVLEAVFKLQAEGKIKLKPKALPSSVSLSDYLKTIQALWYWATVAITLVTSIFFFLVGEAFYPWIYVRNTLGLLFVLYLPGYASTKALFPVNQSTAPKQNLEMPMRIALSIGLSIALVSMVGVILFYSPWGIELLPIVLSLAVFTLVLASVALAREKAVLGEYSLGAA